MRDLLIANGCILTKHRVTSGGGHNNSQCSRPSRTKIPRLVDMGDKVDKVICLLHCNGVTHSHEDVFEA